MTRSVIGDWGRDLKPQQYAMAIAAIGVLAGSYWPPDEKSDTPALSQPDPDRMAGVLFDEWELGAKEPEGGRKPKRLRWGYRWLDELRWAHLLERVSPEIAVAVWERLTKR